MGKHKWAVDDAWLQTFVSNQKNRSQRYKAYFSLKSVYLKMVSPSLCFYHLYYIYHNVDLIVFDKQSSQRMRQNLKMLMEETTRQQSMIRELIETNQQLKSELQLEQNRAAHQEHRANDLEQIMDSVKSKIGELEDESLNRVCQQQNRIKDLLKEHKLLQQEEAEWESINGLLMMHGFKPLCLIRRTDLKDLIVFDKQSSQRMRQNLKMLMEETTRQQSMIRELIETNQQLKSELQLEQNRAAHQEHRANDLEQIMDSVKSKIGELEDESLNRVCQQQNRIKDLLKEHKLLQMKCQHYKKKRMEQEETIASLQREIYRLTKEEEERVVTQNRVFAYLCKRVPHTVLDKQLLCLIDYYESKLRKFHTQRHCKEDDSQSEEEKDYRNLDASLSYKGLLMSLQNQLKESKSKIDTLLGEKLNLQKDLENRPTEHELRLYKQQVKKLEKALKKSIKLQEIIGQKKVDNMEKKDEPGKDSHQQALIDHRYF
ncbi:hypothetical protein A6R68_19335, partial [Neotoma lepida]